jgi:hypothetical protein
LGHSDTDRRYYTGAEHASCNRAASASRQNRRRAEERSAEAVARRWREQYLLDQWRLRVERERLERELSQSRTPRVPRIH